ncbi:MAG TPA: hypothetical protein VKJ65_01270, partial [Phycisphaerae bacterium]|nr:hypothetical protein [Phycisphaerae bacterium]
YNNYIANILVPYFAAQGKYVTTVNQYTNLCFPGTTNINSALYANGINHPAPAAYNLMAQTWFNGIQALSLPPAPSPFVDQRQLNANLVVNGGFEVPIVAANSHNVNPPGAYWVFTSGVSGAGAGIDNGNAYGQGGSLAFDGVQRACVQSSGNGSVTHISQIVSNFVVGQYYQLSFAAEAIAAFAGVNPFHVSIINGTTTNRLFGGGDIVPNTSGYTFYTSAPFRATNSVMTLDFADDGLSVVTYVSWIDDVSIYALPVSIAGGKNNDGQFQVQFIGDTNLSYTVLETTNLTLPLSNWDVMGPALIQGGNSFLFTDITATNYPQRFYKVRLP